MDREAAVEAAIAIGGVVVMVAVVVWIGTAYGADGLGPDGGLALVGAVGFFILLMSGIGIALSFRS
ncbi:MAG: hypothetical protein PPP58_11030 [Natronomonas sp.]